MNDLLFECQFKQNNKAVKGYVYLLVEHQSNRKSCCPASVSLCAGRAGQTRQTAPQQTVAAHLPDGVLSRWAIPYPYSLNLLELFNDPLSLMQQVLFQPVPLIDVNQLDTRRLERFDWLTPATELMRHIRDEDITLIDPAAQ